MAKRLICAIDTGDDAEATRLARALHGFIGGVKLGSEFFTANGPEGVRAITATGMPVFLDLKYSDIPNTVAGAVREATRLGPFMMTVHATGGSAMMRAAVGAALRAAEMGGAERPLVIGITVPTSMDESDLVELGVAAAMTEQVRRLADLAQRAGLDGVVTSAHELPVLRRQCGAGFTLVAPGIRPAWSAADDQKRVLSPAEAVSRGADYLVVGRPITRAQDPADAARRIVDEMRAPA